MTPIRGAWLLLGLSAVAPVQALAEPLRYAILGSLGAVHDDNLYRLSPIEKTTLGPALKSIDDEVLVPRAALDVHIPLSLQDLQFRGAVGSRNHARNTNVDSREYALLARLTGPITQACHATVLVEQTRRLGVADDLDTPGANVKRERHAEIAGDCAVTPRLTIAAGADYREQTSPDRERSRSDLEETAVTTRITHGEAETLQIFAGVSYRFREQPNFLSFVFGRTRARATIWAGGGGGAWAVSPKFRLSGAAYLTSLNENTQRRNERGFVSVDASADWEVSVKTKLKLYATRELTVSPNVGAIAFPQWLVGGLVTWDATPKLSSTFSLQRRRRDILRDRFPVLTDPLSRRERDTTVSADLAVLYAMDDSLKLRLGVDYRRRTANFEDLRFKASTVSVGLVYHFAGVPFETGL